MVYAGMGPDSRVLVKRARKIAQQYFRTYGESIPVKELVRDVAAVMQEFTQQGCACGACGARARGGGDGGAPLDVGDAVACARLAWRC